MSAWNNPQINIRFHALVSDHGYCFADIADILSKEFHVRLSKCACIGRARRLGIVTAPEKKARVMRESALKREAKKRATGSTQLKRQRIVPVNLLHLGNDESPFAVSIFALQNHHCRWVLGDPSDLLFCGDEKSPGCSYCARHALLVFNNGSSHGDH